MISTNIALSKSDCFNFEVMTRGFIIVVLICAYNFGYAQDLSIVDKRKRDAIDKNITLTSDQSAAIDSVFVHYGSEFNRLDLLTDEVESDTLLTEEQVLVRIQMIGQEKKDLRELRELDIRAQLNKEQLVIYDEKILPAMPQVVLFGIHNRVDCDVCKQQAVDGGRWTRSSTVYRLPQLNPSIIEKQNEIPMNTLIGKVIPKAIGN